MPATHTAAVDRTLLYPAFDAKLDALAAACLARGVEYVIICGTRTWAQQDAEYAKGRTVLFDSRGNPQGKVTKAPAGSSPHNYRVAVDWCRNFSPGHPLNPLWSQQKPEHYLVLAEEAERLGLEAGLRWKTPDPPHVQLPLEKHGLTWKMMQDAHALGGDAGVIKLLDSHGPW